MWFTILTVAINEYDSYLIILYNKILHLCVNYVHIVIILYNHALKWTTFKNVLFLLFVFLFAVVLIPSIQEIVSRKQNKLSIQIRVRYSTVEIHLKLCCILETKIKKIIHSLWILYRMTLWEVNTLWIKLINQPVV